MIEAVCGKAVVVRSGYLSKLEGVTSECCSWFLSMRPTPGHIHIGTHCNSGEGFHMQF